MCFEVDFCIPLEDGNFRTVHTEVILSEGFTHCSKIANEIANSLEEEEIRVFIGDFFA